MSEPKVTYERTGSIGRVTLNSPETMNAVDDALMEALLAAVVEANCDRETLVTVVAAVGPNFSAGGDLNWEGDLDAEAAARTVRFSGHVSHELRNSPKPTIGAIRGYCLGGGDALNLHLDAAIASETARFGHPETRWGLLPFWYQPQLLPLIVGERKAREILLFGRSYSAAQALEMGLCNAVVPDDQLEAEVDSWAGELTERGRIALHLTRIALNASSDMLRVAANHEAAMVGAVSGTDAYRSQVLEFFELSKARRRPREADTDSSGGSG